MSRLHAAGIDLFWTDVGEGHAPDPKIDNVWGNIVVEVEPLGKKFTVKGSEEQKDYNSWLDGGQGISRVFVWSLEGNFYHTEDCPVIKNIKTKNKVSGEIPPPIMSKHSCVQDSLIK
jgi:hypothetical protein